MHDARPHIEKAIRLAGSEEKLGSATGYSQNAIWHAKQRGSVTAKMAIAIEKATSGEVKRSELCPDIFNSPVSEQEA